MRRRNGGGDRIDRGRHVRQLLHAARQAGLVAVLAVSVGALPSAGAAAGPPRPGDPPDKQTAGITVPPDDPAITAGAAEYPGITGPLLGYLAAPKGGDVYPGILVIHDRQGLSGDRKSTRLNSSHVNISYAVFCLKKKHTKNELD